MSLFDEKKPKVTSQIEFPDGTVAVAYGDDGEEVAKVSASHIYAWVESVGVVEVAESNKSKPSN